MRRRTAAGILAAPVAASLLLAGCGSSSKTVKAASTASSQAAPTAAAPTTLPATTTTVAATLETASSPKLGQIIVDAQRFTLYMNTREKGGTIACTGGCATEWPPLTVRAGATPTGGPGVTGTIATKTRPDGTLQVTYNGAPLYRYAPDKAPGDTNGQGVGGIWFVVPLGGSSAAAGGGGTTATTVVTRATTPATTASCAYPPCP